MSAAADGAWSPPPSPQLQPGAAGVQPVQQGLDQAAASRAAQEDGRPEGVSMSRGPAAGARVVRNNDAVVIIVVVARSLVGRGKEEGGMVGVGVGGEDEGANKP